VIKAPTATDAVKPCRSTRSLRTAAPRSRTTPG